MMLNTQRCFILKDIIHSVITTAFVMLCHALVCVLVLLNHAVSMHIFIILPLLIQKTLKENSAEK